MTQLASTRPSWWRMLLVGVLGLAALLMFLVYGAHARLDAATITLLLAALGLLICLRSMFNVVQAVARPGHVVHIPNDRAATTRELREEKRRLLRAINELRFDYELGKLSEADYKVVREGYELRAVEVMRELDGSDALRPELIAELRSRGVRIDGTAPVPSSVSSTAAPTASAEAGSVEPAVPHAPVKNISTSAVLIADDFDVGDEDDEMATVVRRRCRQCEVANDSDARFCKSCGTELS